MAEQIQLKVLKRDAVGGKNPRRLRRAGIIPAVLYQRGKATIPLGVIRAGAEKKISDIHENQILNLEIEGEKDAGGQLAIIKEIQYDHLKGAILHVDLKAITLDEKLTATVPLVDLGEAVGVTRDGGVLEHVLREIEIECLAAQLPEEIALDVSALEIGDSLKVSDLHLPEGVKILTDPELIVFTVSPPRLEEVKVEVAKEEAAAPEVIGREKAEEEKEPKAEPDSRKTTPT